MKMYKVMYNGKIELLRTPNRKKAEGYLALTRAILVNGWASLESYYGNR